MANVKRHPDYQKLAGWVLMLGVTQFLISLMVAEETYPGYSVSADTISQLGEQVCKGGFCHFIQPSADIFNISIVVLGITLIITSYLLSMDWGHFGFFNGSVAIAGAGAIGVGVTLAVPPIGWLHITVSFITFLFINATAIYSYKIIGYKPFAVVSIVLGAAGLIALISYAMNIYLGLGEGGMERMIVYPSIAWVIAFSGYLMGRVRAN